MFLTFKLLLCQHGHPQSFSSSTKMSRIFVFKFLALSTRNIRKKSVWLVLDRPIKIVHTPLLPDWADLLGEIFTGQKIPELSLLLCKKNNQSSRATHIQCTTHKRQNTSALLKSRVTTAGSGGGGRGGTALTRSDGANGPPLSTLPSFPMR